METAPNLSRLREVLSRTDSVRLHGSITKVVGVVIESVGPRACLGEVCAIQVSRRQTVLAEVVGFTRQPRAPHALRKHRPGTRTATRSSAWAVPSPSPLGPGLQGRVLDGLGHPLDDLGEIEAEAEYPVTQAPPHPLRRQRISQPLSLGARSIDGLLTCGKGQRIGIFAGSGVGKSTLLGMIARYTAADVNVIALIGERGREVREFIERDLGRGGPAPLRGRGRHLRPAAHAAPQGRPRRHRHRRVFPRPGPGRHAA